MKTGHSRIDDSTAVGGSAADGNASQPWHETNYGISFFGIKARHIFNNQK